MRTCVSVLIRSWLVWWYLKETMWRASAQDLVSGFYDFTCPAAEILVTNTVTQHFLLDNTIAAPLIRLMFHDCLVVGCDASILLNGTNSEQANFANQNLRGYSVISDAKTQIEAVCPGIVSCADIIVLAARDSIGLLGGPLYAVLTGRLDGLSPGVVNLPKPDDSVSTSIIAFAAVGLSVEDMVTLIGAHTVGTSQCANFNTRLYNFNNTGSPDPTVNVNFLPTLQQFCPQGSNLSDLAPLDVGSEFLFDTSYYKNALSDQAVLQIDQEIALNSVTSGIVSSLAAPGSDFFSSFIASFTKMGNIGLKDSTSGEVRRFCEMINS